MWKFISEQFILRIYNPLYTCFGDFIFRLALVWPLFCFTSPALVSSRGIHFVWSEATLWYKPKHVNWGGLGDLHWKYVPDLNRNANAGSLSVFAWVNRFSQPWYSSFIFLLHLCFEMFSPLRMKKVGPQGREISPSH